MSLFLLHCFSFPRNHRQKSCKQNLRLCTWGTDDQKAVSWWGNGNHRGEIHRPKGAEIVICGKQTHLTGKASDSMWLIEKKQFRALNLVESSRLECCKIRHHSDSTIQQSWLVNKHPHPPGPVTSPGKPMVFFSPKNQPWSPKPQQPQPVQLPVERCWGMRERHEWYEIYE